MLHQDGSPTPRCIQEGDLAVVYERFDSMKAVTVTAKGQFQNKFGTFLMKDWIGKPFGTKLRSSKNGSGWVYVLAPTPELWTQVLRHRTQILYVADISMVCMMLELRPGCTVLESGTGSGSLTTSLARAVAPTGHVHTFEFHEQRAATAAEEFKRNGLGELVTVTQRDIEGQGFPGSLHGKADAVFLDLPGPWKVVPSAAQCLRPDGVFCGFSPCIEQVQRTCEALNANGFRELRTMEVLLRQYEVTHEALIEDLDGGASSGKGRRQQRQQGGRQQQQQQQQRQPAAGGAEEGQASKRRKTDEQQQQQGEGEEKDGQQESREQQQEAGEALSSEAQPEDGAVDNKGEASAEQHGGPAGGSQQQEGGIADDGQGQQARPAPKERRVLARPLAPGRGHTGYLTFARKAVPATA